MNKSVHITCPKCGYMIKGRPWRCPGCGGSDSDQQTGETKKSPHKLQDRIIAALHARKRKEV